jgi:hypothetical protein
VRYAVHTITINPKNTLKNQPAYAVEKTVKLNLDVLPREGYIKSLQLALVAQWIERLLAEQKAWRSSRHGGARKSGGGKNHRLFV